MSHLTETPEFVMGSAGERAVAELLVAQGWAITPRYQFSGDGAPRLAGSLGSWVIPDLDAAKAGIRVYVEVKTKSAPAYDPIAGIFHGFNLQHALDYQRVQEETGTPVYVAVYELSSGDVWVASLDELWDVHWKGRMPLDRCPMFNFPRSAMHLLGRVP